MRKQLDEEMPVKEANRRRFGWWWFALAGLVLLTAGASLMSWGNDAVQAVPAAKPTAPSVKMPLEATHTSPIVATNKMESKQSLNEKGNNKSEPIRNKQPLSTKSKAKNNAVKTPDSIYDFSGMNAAITTLTAEKVLNNSQNPLDNKAEFGEAKVNEFSSLKMPTPSLLESQALVAFNTPNHIPNIATEAFNPKMSQWHFALEGMGARSINSVAKGGSVHILANKTLKNNKLSIEAGLGYSFIQQPLNVVEVSLAMQGGPITSESNDLVYYGTQENAKFEASSSNGDINTKYKFGLNLH
ncbi:MAG: hypothetical protein MUC59_18470, partial [Saprospiraceae bacterium]|nr:hypothetical protein [Saprospiraceae bacterium]